MTVLMALSTIAMSQAKPTEHTMERCLQLMDYLATLSDTKIRFYASDMVVNIHLDESYLSESKARSRACGQRCPEFTWWICIDKRLSSIGCDQASRSFRSSLHLVASAF